MKNKVVHKLYHVPTPHDIYIGRPSILGNPYSHKTGTLALYRTATATEAVVSYATWLKIKIVSKDPEILRALQEIQDDSILVCWCKSPQNPEAPCHGSVLWKARNWAKKEKYIK